jgi:hypothetical protein
MHTPQAPVSAEEAEATRLNYLSPVYKIDEGEHSKLISEAAEVRRLFGGGGRGIESCLGGGGGEGFASCSTALMLWQVESVTSTVHKAAAALASKRRGRHGRGQLSPL